MVSPLNENDPDTKPQESPTPIPPGNTETGDPPLSDGAEEAVEGRRWLASFREEIVDFQRAVRDAPRPKLRWDILGIRSLVSRVIARLLSEHVEPWKMAVAVFVGVVIGCSPFYGLHILMCLVAALGLRLNKLIVWLGSNTSIPLIAPFFALVSIQCGHLILHGTTVPLDLATLRETGAINLLGYWLLGFPIVGAATGLLLGGITYRLALRHQNRRKLDFLT